MFTGIISAVGVIDQVAALGSSENSGVGLWIDAKSFKLAAVKLGDSIAINGACMTVVELDAPRFRIDVSHESLLRTVGLDRPGRVNLEGALRLGDSLDGHLVTGHVDGVGDVVSFDAAGESRTLVIRTDSSLAPFLAYKGSVAINGVSLTVNQVTDHEKGCDISINLIPHTLENTTLSELAPGARVNLEVDPLARYAARVLSLSLPAEPVATSLEHLAV